MVKPALLLLAEKEEGQCKLYKETYFAHQQEIPYRFYFTSLQGHVDELKAQSKEKWTAENALNIPAAFKTWNFAPNAVNAPQDSPYRIKKSCQSKYDYIIKMLTEHPEIEGICIGTDDDIEGSFLASAFLSTLPAKYQRLPRYRLFIDDLSSQTILAAMKHLPRETECLPDSKATFASFNNSGILRSQVNFAMGTSLTRALTVKAQKFIRVGYVKGPIIQLVNKRYQQFVNFKPETFYQGSATIVHPNGNFSAKLVDEKNHQLRFKTQLELQQVLQTLPQQSTILKQERKRKITLAPQFFKKTELQGILNQRYNMPLKRSEQLLEKLYHEDLLLTYPRTDSVVIKRAQAPELPAIVTMCMSIPALKPYAQRTLKLNRFKEVVNDPRKRWVNDKKVSIHPALMLNTKEHKSFNWDDYSRDEQQILYEVALRCLLPFLEPKETAETSIDIAGNDTYHWRATGSTIIKAGWSELKHKRATDDEVKHSLPTVNVGDDVAVNSEAVKGQTKPQPLYTIKTLMTHLGTLSNLQDVLPNEDRKLLQNFAQGIGTSSTRATIIDQLISNKSLRLTKKGEQLPAKRLIPTEAGIDLADTLNQMGILQLSDVVHFEMDLTAVQNQEMSAKAFQEKYFELTQKQVDQVLNVGELQISPSEKQETNAVGHCPLCGGNVIERKNSYTCEHCQYTKMVTGEWKHSGCDFAINKHAFGAKQALSNKAMQKLLAGDVSPQLTFHSKRKNKDFKARLRYNFDKQQLELVF